VLAAMAASAAAGEIAEWMDLGWDGTWDPSWGPEYREGFGPAVAGEARNILDNPVPARYTGDEQMSGAFFENRLPRKSIDCGNGRYSGLTIYIPLTMKKQKRKPSS